MKIKKLNDTIEYVKFLKIKITEVEKNQMNLPNFLTLIRFLLVPVMTIFLVKQNFTIAITSYILAGITDVLDGYIARKYNLITKLGKILDPMADKLLQFSALVGLWIIEVIPFWITLIFFLKEIFMGLGAIKLLKNKDVVVPSKWFGKLSTIFFFIAIIFSMLSVNLVILKPYVLPMFILALLSLFFAFTMYLINFIKVTKKSNN